MKIEEATAKILRKRSEDRSNSENLEKNAVKTETSSGKFPSTEMKPQT
jgi:hypothetical protein